MKTVMTIFIFCCQLFFTGIATKSEAQTIKYSSENVFVGNPDKLFFIGIGDNYHLISFIGEDKPSISIFNKDLQLRGKAIIPFRFPDKSSVRIISLKKFYYVLIYTSYNPRYILWRVDANGNVNDMTDVFREFISSKFRGSRSRFELVVNQDQLYMLYHSYLADVRKNQTTILQLDSLFNVVYTNKVMYKLDRGDAIQQEKLLGDDLVILKTGRQGTSLVLLKVNLKTGYTINNTFYSSGYPYTQSGFNYNNTDSTFTVYSLLKEPRALSNVKRLVFVSRMNNFLIEERPFALLKSQFEKNTGINFLQVAGDQWIRLRTEQEQGTNYTYYTNYPNYTYDFYSNTYRNPTYNNTTDPLSPNYNNISLVTLPQQRSVTRSVAGNSKPAVRFSLLDKDLSKTSDSLMANNKNAHTVQPDNTVSFSANNKSYMLIGQRFYKKSNGLLMVNSNDANNLVYTDIRVNNRNEYLLLQSKIIPHGVIIPYTHRREAGLVKISVE